MENSKRDFLVEYLNANPDVRCPGCGYNLHLLTSGRCPECGDELTLQIGLAEPRQAACITGLIGLAAGVGFSALLLVFCVFRGAPPVEAVLTLFGGLIVEGAGTLVLLKFWKTIRRLPSGRRWLLVAGCWLLTFANLAVFTCFVRG